MSLQVSNQNPSGRRTPQVYQGFGGVVTAPNVTTTPTATNGGGVASGGPPNAPGSGSVGRPAKGNNKQSQIPVAIGSMVGTPSNLETAVPQTAVVHPGTAGPTDASPGKKQMQSDHLYGVKQQGGSMTMVPATAATGTNRSTTNGSQPGGNEKMRKSSTNGGADGMAAKKPEPTATQHPTLGEGGVGKGRAPTNARAQQKQSLDDVAQAKGSEQQPKPEKKASAAEFENSLLTEKPLKGFCSDGEEMESLLLEPWELEDTQSLARSIAGKSKMQKAAPQAQARVSPFKAGGKLDTAAAVAALDRAEANSQNKKAQAAETEGEKNRSPKATPKGAETDAPSTPTNVGDSLIGRPLRSISGRRSTRPIADIKFTHHRRSAANDSISSMNVTIGSEIGNDSLLLRTPGSAARKRKDMTPESTSDDAPVVDSPKRARLDFSGFLGMVATPVTMLKNRLSRVKLHSTPRALVVDEEDGSKVVTAEATTTTANNMPTEKEADEAGKPDGTTTATAMEVDVAAKEKSDEAGQTPVSEKDGTEQQQQEGSAASTVVDDEVEVKIVTDQQQQQKQWCSIM